MTGLFLKSDTADLCGNNYCLKRSHSRFRKLVFMLWSLRRHSHRQWQVVHVKFVCSAGHSTLHQASYNNRVSTADKRTIRVIQHNYDCKIGPLYRWTWEKSGYSCPVVDLCLQQASTWYDRNKAIQSLVDLQATKIFYAVENKINKKVTQKFTTSTRQD